MKPITLTALLGATYYCSAATIPATLERDELLPKRIPTSYESAVMGRRILALTPLGTIATTFPKDSNDKRRPPDVGGMPHSLMEYISDCENDDKGNPTLLAITISTTFRNIAAGSNVSLAVQWTPPHPPAKRIQRSSSSWCLTNQLRSFFGLSSSSSSSDSEEYDPAPYSAANLPRFSLLGHIERIALDDDQAATAAAISTCYTKTHPDARYWLPGNRIHTSYFVRLVVDRIYWVGGFGDRAFIGWIPVEEWNKVSRQEWESIRLPGEKKGWKEWSLDDGNNDL
ncbi:Pyridoxamine 5'-phosphate oxidase domain containing protein [Rhypophila decipiens]